MARRARGKRSTRQKLDGRAWSGTSGIARVDVSIDRGSTWTEAKVHGRNGPGTWAQFTYTLPGQPPGSYELWARATDEAGRTQPTTSPFNTLGYLFDAVVRHPVVLS